MYLALRRTNEIKKDSVSSLKWIKANPQCDSLLAVWDLITVVSLIPFLRLLSVAFQRPSVVLLQLKYDVAFP